MMRPTEGLPVIPWLGPLATPSLGDAERDRLVRVLRHRPAAREPGRGAYWSAILGLAATLIWPLALHHSVSRGSLGVVPSSVWPPGRTGHETRGVTGMAPSTHLVAGTALALAASVRALGGFELSCFGECVGLPAGIRLTDLRDLQLGSAVYQDGSFLVWNYGGEQWGQFDVPASVQQVHQLEIGRHALALLTNRTVVAWGANSFGEATPPQDLNNVRLIRVAEFHSVAVRSDDSVVCWGNNGVGQCTPPTDLGAVLDVRSGSHSVALRPDSTIKCWGWNGWGQCSVPADIEPIKAISVMYAHTVVLTESGRVRCWGRNAEGQCDVPSKLGPVQAISAGGLHTAALLESGTVVCWGSNAFGQCNATSTTNASLLVAGPQTTLVVANQCPADIDRNNLVNGIDLAIILSKWGTNGGADYPGADVDRSGIVDGGDLAHVLNFWGPCQ